MQRNDQLNYRLIACIVLSSLVLQSCDSFPTQLTATLEESTSDNPKIARVVEGEEELPQREATALGYFEDLPIELVPMIFSEIDYPYILACRQLNHFFYELITGYPQVGLIGVDHKPIAKMKISICGINKCVDFEKLSCTPETIPSFPFYYLMREVKNLLPSLWSYIPSTQIHTLDLEDNQIGDSGIQELAKVLSDTQIYTLNLEGNQIGDTGVQELAKVLPNTQVHTLKLGDNDLGDIGMQELAKVLSSTQVHTLNLNGNQIDSSGVQALAKVLPNTQVHTLNLWGNQIGNEIQRLLKEQHPNITFSF